MAAKNKIFANWPFTKIQVFILDNNLEATKIKGKEQCERQAVILKEIKKKYRLKVKNFSCHSLRKTFGRQVYTMNGENSELALVKLMELFNHSSVAITKRYLGLRQEEILETYDCLTF